MNELTHDEMQSLYVHLQELKTCRMELTACHLAAKKDEPMLTTTEAVGVGFGGGLIVALVITIFLK